MMAEPAIARPVFRNRAERRQALALARARTVKRQHGGGQKEPRRSVSRDHLRRWDRIEQAHVEFTRRGRRQTVLWTVWLSPEMAERLRDRIEMENDHG